jgi:hypothetical protein
MLVVRRIINTDIAIRLELRHKTGRGPYFTYERVLLGIASTLLPW